ncbi:MAG: DUF4129 domain-containing protein [Salinibacter sp.]
MSNGPIRHRIGIIALAIVVSIGGMVATAEEPTASEEDDPCRRESSSWLPPLFSRSNQKDTGNGSSSSADDSRDDSASPTAASEPDGSAPSSGPALTMPNGSGLYWIALVLLAIGAVFVISRLAGSVMIDRQYGDVTGDVDTTEGTSASSLAEPDGLWSEAERHAEAGRYREAVRLLYRDLLQSLHQAGLIEYEQGRTNWEYLRHVRAQGHDELRSLLQTLTQLFEASWYGRASLTAEDYQRARRLAADIRGGLTL